MIEYINYRGRRFIPEVLTPPPPPPPPPPSLPLWVLRGDEEMEEFNFESRTSPTNDIGKFACTPSAYRFFPLAKKDAGDFRVNISPLLSAYIALHGEDSIDDPKTRYFFGPTTGMFNRTGYPMQAYITTSRNVFYGQKVGDWLRFMTLTPNSNVTGMTYATHPHFVHRFDLVCWTKQPDETFTTTHKWNTPQGIIDYYLVTKEGVAWIPIEYVRPLVQNVGL